MICSDCMESMALAQFVIGRGQLDQCAHCGNQGTVVDEQVLLEHIEALFETVLVPFDELDTYQKCSFLGGAALYICEIWEILGSDPATTSDTFEQSLIDHLTNEFVNPDGREMPEYFAINKGDGLTENQFLLGWEDFLNSVEHSHRFFNCHAKVFLDELFHILTDDFNLAGKGIFDIIDINNPVYRARIADSESVICDIEKNPYSQLGPTPAHLASDQRMSPTGISVFYGAYDRGTCISEIRPLVGDNVISGEFRPSNELKLIDLNKLPDCSESLDIYDDDFVKHAHASDFFNKLVFNMSRPARRNVGNPYLPTQIIFEYMRVKFKDFADGILYRSVQQDQSGHCIALFPDSSLSGQFPLKFVDGSLRYHYIHAVSYEQRSYDDVDRMKITESSLAKVKPKDERETHAH